MRSRARIWVRIGLLALCGLAGGGVALRGADIAAPQGGLTKVRPLHAFVTRENETSYTISLDDDLSARIEDEKPGEESFSVEGVLYQMDTEKMLSVRSSCQDLFLKAAQCDEWLAVVPIGQQVLVRPNPNTGLLDVISPSVNTRNIKVRFCDGARTTMPPGAALRFELMNDGSYYATGVGLIETFNADGLAIALGPQTLPLTGGELRPVTLPDGTTVLQRDSPVVDVVIAGDLGSGLTLMVGDQVISLAGDSPQRVVLPSGAALQLGLDPSTQQLFWTVESGYFQFQVEGIPSYTAFGMDDQAAAQQWSLPDRTISLQNLTPGGPDSPVGSILVSPDGHSYAHLDRGATMMLTQYEGPGTFSIAVAGGGAGMFDLGSGQDLPLGSRNLLFVGGQLDDGSGLPGGNPWTAGGPRMDTLGADDPSRIFYEAAGAGGSSGGQSPGTPSPAPPNVPSVSMLQFGGQLDSSRIPQVPISPIR